MNDTELWRSMMSLFSDEDLIRWRKRATLHLPESEARYNLMCALEEESDRRALLDQIVAPPLTSQ